MTEIPRLNEDERPLYQEIEEGWNGGKLKEGSWNIESGNPKEYRVLQYLNNFLGIILRIMGEENKRIWVATQERSGNWAQGFGTPTQARLKVRR
jgi:hypothetical protein